MIDLVRAKFMLLFTDFHFFGISLPWKHRLPLKTHSTKLQSFLNNWCNFHIDMIKASLVKRQLKMLGISASRCWLRWLLSYSCQVLSVHRFFVFFFPSSHFSTGVGAKREREREKKKKIHFSSFSSPTRSPSVGACNFQAFAFADQILPGSGTFDLSIGLFSLSKV